MADYEQQLLNTLSGAGEGDFCTPAEDGDLGSTNPGVLIKVRDNLKEYVMRGLPVGDSSGTCHACHVIALTTSAWTAQDLGILGLPLNDLQVAPLKQKCHLAPFGRGEQTVVNPEVRHTWQLDPTQFSITNPGEMAAKAEAWSDYYFQFLQSHVPLLADVCMCGCRAVPRGTPSPCAPSRVAGRYQAGGVQMQQQPGAGQERQG
jgi:hypothetical protein